MTVDELKAKHGGNWGSHPNLPVADWQYQVANDGTRLGYWEWVLVEIQVNPEIGVGDHG